MQVFSYQFLRGGAV